MTQRLNIISRPSLETTVAGMFSSLAETNTFHGVLAHLSEFMSSTITCLHAEEFEQRNSRLVTAGGVPESEFSRIASDYAQRWGAENPWIAGSLPSLRDKGYEHGEAVISSRELESTGFYTHFLKPLGIKYGMGIHVWSDNPSNMALATLHRSPSCSGFDDEDLRRVESIRPYLVSAYSIYRRFAQLESRVDSLRMGFENSPLGMMLLDDEGRLVEANHLVHERLLGTSLLSIDNDNRLRFASEVLDKSYQRALSQLLRMNSLPLVLPIRDMTGRMLAMALHLCRVPAGAMVGFDRRVSVMGFISVFQRENYGAWAEDIIHHALGLTRAESRVANALLLHSEIGLVASVLGLSEGTVRTHIKSIHSRLGLKRTSDVLLLLDRLLGVRSPK